LAHDDSSFARRRRHSYNPRASPSDGFKTVHVMSAEPNSAAPEGGREAPLRLPIFRVRVYLGWGGEQSRGRAREWRRGGSRRGIETYLLAQLAPVQAAAILIQSSKLRPANFRARDIRAFLKICSRPCKLNSGPRWRRYRARGVVLAATCVKNVSAKGLRRNLRSEWLPSK